MANPLKLALYRAARSAGLFAWARRATCRRLRFLAYHGFATGDELHFRPKLFMAPATFERRMRTLRDQNFKVVSLNHAVRSLRRGVIDENCVVITIDDGYASTLRFAAPVLRSLAMPSTVYITSYHAQKQTPVFDLVVGFMLWKTTCKQAVLCWPPQATPLDLPLTNTAERERAADALVALGKAQDGEQARVDLCRELGNVLAVPYEKIVERGCFRLMAPAEIRQLADLGMSVGLHTHRHRFPPDDLAVCRSELVENEAKLREWIELVDRHFCYPSGVYADSQWPLLESLGVASSTTCEPGLVEVGDPPHGLRRFLDGENVSQIEFEAEISGFAELLRRAVRRPSAVTLFQSNDGV